ncbi:MAG: hypothetical protein PHE67_04445 [Campylobacterales bacterium]|nr:hypothetical protein [Campylobacterales bacterium]
MVSVSNFISFLTLNGFFIGLVFAVLKIQDPFYIIFAVSAITAIFYMMALLASALFIKSVSFQPRYRIKKEKYETAIDTAITEIEKRERVIKEMYEFIRNLEAEEYEDMRREAQAAAQSRRRI